jgi:catechol 2,3-dioxygenase-like lactoylglutathione lyase family enzyme
MNLNHVALSVPDLDAACKFYQSVFGFRKIKPDKLHDRKTSPRGPIFRIYGDQLKQVKVAYLSSGNGVGFELFQFIDPPYRSPESSDSSMPFDYTRGGLYHVGVTVPNVQETLHKMIKLGAKQVGELIEVYEDVATYVKDPWGNVVELLSGSFEQILANRI